MAEKKKPGVMMYFRPMRESADSLSDAQLAALIRALFAYADPDEKAEPQFEDDALRQIWPYVQSLVDRDDERYRKTSQGRQYAQFCRWYRRYEEGEPPSREDWEDAGCPSYKDWHTNVSSTNLYPIQMYTPDTNVSNNPDTHDTNVSDVSGFAGSPSNSNPFPLPQTDTETNTKDVYRRIEPKAELVDPALSPWLDAWIAYSEEHGKRMTGSTRDMLIGEMNRYRCKYDEGLVAALIDEACNP